MRNRKKISNNKLIKVVCVFVSLPTLDLFDGGLRRPDSVYLAVWVALLFFMCFLLDGSIWLFGTFIAGISPKPNHFGQNWWVFYVLLVSIHWDTTERTRRKKTVLLCEIHCCILFEIWSIDNLVADVDIWSCLLT